jgi:hypothetical protein
MMYEIRAAAAPMWSDSVDLLIVERQWGESKIRRVVSALTVKDVTEGDFLEPSLRLTRDAAQQLIDNLWQCGLRPSEGTGSAGALAATQEHLKDMRRLVFDKPNAQGSGQESK